MENLYTPNSIRTVSGIYVDIVNPKPEMFKIEDMAHSLSRQPRWGGHLPDFDQIPNLTEEQFRRIKDIDNYSVAQHSCLVADIVSKPNKKTALMHDGSEAFLCDMPSPIKKLLSQYQELEDRIMKVISEKFQFEWPMPQEVKDADQIMLLAEWHGLMLQQPSKNPILPLKASVARKLFLDTFHSL